jgi:hypothetical protein
MLALAMPRASCKHGERRHRTKRKKSQLPQFVHALPPANQTLSEELQTIKIGQPRKTPLLRAQILLLWHERVPPLAFTSSPVRRRWASPYQLLAP